jgi:4-amino-4-deoxy-L-arabinose transferase-like glycosyltransferase
MTVAKREWREPADRHPSRLGLALALVAAALLRFWALPHGIPFSVQVDEPEVMERAVRMMKTGDFNPHFFDYPTLYMYVEAALSVFRFLVGAMRGQWSALAQAPSADFYLWGRAVTATLGTATVLLVYRAGMRWGGPTALLAAVLLAVMPLHVRESHYVLTDVPVTFLVTLTFLLSLRAHERSTVWAFALAGAAAGLAGATKYNGALAVVMPMLACAMTPAVRPSRFVAMLWIVAAMIGAFLVAAPYTFLDLPTFLNQFARLSSEYRSPAATLDPIWQIYLKHLRNALHWPASLLVILGVGLGIARIFTGPDRINWVLATVFPLLYFRFVSTQSIFYGRYLLPLVPFLSLLAAAGVVWIVGCLRRFSLPRQARNLATVALTLAAIAPPAYNAIQFDANEAKMWTTQQAYDWIMREVPRGAKVTIESRQMLLPPAYQATYVAQLRLHSFEDYDAQGVDYLVASSQSYGNYLDVKNDGPQKYPSEYADYQRIFWKAREVARFTPSDDHPGPELRILKVKP